MLEIQIWKFPQTLELCYCLERGGNSFILKQLFVTGENIVWHYSFCKQTQLMMMTKIMDAVSQF